MARFILRESMTVIASLFLLLVPVIGQAQTKEASVAPPPIGQQLVREGTFAVALASAFSLDAGENEAEAESRLGEVGIMPRNGWIADYPVTPDIIAELQKSVSDAADADKLDMNREEALKNFEEVKAGLGLSIKPYKDGDAYTCKPPKCENYPDPAAVNNYYADQGPPVVTYYAPPPDYYYLYGWVPSPFWWYGFWFPGFFILNDFHRSVYIHDRPFFVSNHFNDIRRNRVFRVDPADRFRGRTYAGIGVTNPRSFISTGVPGSSRVIFNGSRRAAPTSVERTLTPSSRGSRSFSAPSRSGSFSGQSIRGGSMENMPSRSVGGGGGSIQRGGRR